MKTNENRFSIKNSTREFWQESCKLTGHSLFDWLHGYVYGRWPYLYIGIGVGEHPLSKQLGPLVRRINKLNQRLQRALAFESPALVEKKPGFADAYHGKVVPLQAATQLVQVNEPIKIPNLEQVIPYQRARDLIMLNPEHIVVLECPCRAARPDPCLPLEVCLIIGEPFASFTIDHHPDRARWISQQEAVEILQAEDERGHVHHAFFKDAMLDRFYAICNCCSCCCGAMQAQRGGTPMLASSGYIAAVDEQLCIACETCKEYCQFEALSLSDWALVVDWDQCMGCGVCVDKCDQGAISLRREPAKGVPLELRELLQGLPLVE